jgi:hypothetical protein
LYSSAENRCLCGFQPVHLCSFLITANPFADFFPEHSVKEQAAGTPVKAHWEKLIPVPEQQLPAEGHPL